VEVSVGLANALAFVATHTHLEHPVPAAGVGVRVWTDDADEPGLVVVQLYA
jgi:hypothetical protein